MASAGKIKGITIVLDGDTTKLGKALSNVTHDSAKLHKELKEVERALKFEPGNTELIAQKQKILAENIELTTQRLKKLKDAQAQVEAQFKRGDISAEQYRAFRREVVLTESALKTLKQKLADVGGGTNGLDKLKNKLKQVGTAAKEVGKEISGALSTGAAATTAAVGGLTVGMQDFNQDLARLKTNASMAGNDLKLVEDAFMKITQVTGETDSAVETVSNLLATGFKDNQLADMIDQINGAAIKFSDTLKTEGIADGIQETFATGEAIGQFAELLERSGVNLEDFNIKLQQAQAEGEGTQFIMQTMADLGFGAVTEKYKELNPEVQKSAEANAKLQKAMADLALVLAPLVVKVTEIITKFVEWANNNPKLVTTIATLAGIITAISATFSVLSPIISNVSKIFTLIRITMVALTGPIGLVIAAVTGLIVVFKEFFGIDLIQAGKDILGGLLSGLLEAVAPVRDFIVNLATNIINWFKQLLGINSPSLVFMEFGVNIIQGLINGIQSLLGLVGEIITTVGTTIITAMTAVWGGISAFLQGIWQGIGNVCMTVWNGITTFLQGIWNGISNTCKTIWNGIVTFLSGIWNGIKTTITTVWNGITTFLQGIWNGIKTTATAIFNSIKTFFTTAWNGIATTVKTVWNGIKTTITTVFNSIKTFLSTGINAVKTLFSNGFNAVKTVVTTIFNAIKTIITTVFNNIKTVSQGVWNSIKTAVNSVKTVISNAWNAVKNVTTTVFNAIKKAIVGPIEWARDKVKAAIDAVKGFFSKLEFKLPKIKLPHFKLSGGFSLNPLSVPKLSVDWYDKGGIFTGPQIIGVGEKRPEFVGALEDLREIVSASMVDVMGLTKGGTMSGGSTYNNAQTYQPNITIVNQASETAPSEIARKSLQTQRQLAMEWGIN